MISLKEGDLEKFIVFLYSNSIIDESVRDDLQGLSSHHSQAVKTSIVLSRLEAIIQKRPRVYGQVIEIFAEQLCLSSPVAILRELFYFSV